MRISSASPPQSFPQSPPQSPSSVLTPHQVLTLIILDRIVRAQKLGGRRKEKKVEARRRRRRLLYQPTLLCDRGERAKEEARRTDCQSQSSSTVQLSRARDREREREERQSDSQTVPLSGLPPLSTLTLLCDRSARCLARERRRKLGGGESLSDSQSSSTVQLSQARDREREEKRDSQTVRQGDSSLHCPDCQTSLSTLTLLCNLSAQCLARQTEKEEARRRRESAGPPSPLSTVQSS